MGQIIILILIQTGGLGIMTFTSLFGLFFSGNLSFQNKILLKDMLSSDSINEVFKILFQIAFFTLTIEAIGAFLIFIELKDGCPLDFGDRVFFSIFHSVSAFCNAGFSTVSNNLYEPWLRFNYNIHLTIAFLIIFGGIGFPIILNYFKLLKIKTNNSLARLFHTHQVLHIPRIISINTKIVVRTTIALLAFGTIAFFLLEYNNTLSEHGFWGKIVESFFNSVTPRTAGFNSVNMSSLLGPTLLIIIFLMWVGASPASTGGGIKTSTFGITILNIFSLAKSKDRTEFGRREIPAESVKRSYAIIALSIFILGAGLFLLSLFEPEKSIMSLCFEAVSAYGTVGLSLGITPTLSNESKLTITVIMFMGRVGTFTILVGIFRKIATTRYHYPSENIFIN